MAAQTKKIYLLDNYRLDPDKRQLYLDEAPVRLTPRPFRVLLYLLENRDRVVTRDELLDQFWEGRDVYDDTLRKCVGAIRKALNDRSQQARFIETHYAGGYRYIGSVEEIVEETSQAVEIERVRGVRMVIEEEIDNPITSEPARKVVAVAKQRTLTRPVAVLALLATVVLTASVSYELRNSGTTDAATSPLRSVAVLPFKNYSNDEAQEYFSDGLTETFITQLSKIGGVKVISRDSVFALKGKDIDSREVGKRLNVTAVLEGSIRQKGDLMRVEVRLINTQDGSVIWTRDPYTLPLKDSLTVRDEIACSVAAGLRVKFCRNSEVRRHDTDNIDAYQMYLKGRYYWNKRNPDGIRRSIEQFEQAISLDPNYALAYAGLADSYVQGVWEVPFDPKEVLQKAKAAATEAIKLDAQLSEAHAALANIYQMEWQWAEAGKEIERAIELNPGLARAYHVQAFHLEMTGRPIEAIASMKHAQALDPLNLVIGADMARLLWNAGRQDEALSQGQKVVEMDPGFTYGHILLFSVYLYSGRDDAFAEEYYKYLTLSGRSEPTITAYRKAFHTNGVKGIYQIELGERLQDQKEGRYSSIIHIAKAYALIGKKEQALKYLELACQQRSAEICWIKTASELNTLRSDPRFADLLRRIGLPG